MTKITESTGNVFKDMGFKNHEDLKAKAELARQIAITIETKNLTQKAAEQLTGVNQGDISKIINGRCERFTVDRLLGMLLKLGQNINITIEPTTDDMAHYFIYNSNENNSKIGTRM